jgi:hypothetical protein
MLSLVSEVLVWLRAFNVPKAISFTQERETRPLILPPSVICDVLQKYTLWRKRLGWAKRHVDETTRAKFSSEEAKTPIR